MKKKRDNMKHVLLLIVLAIILVLIVLGGPPAIGKITNEEVEEAPPLFSVDQILIKTLIKEGESMTRQINVMDISEKDLIIEIEPLYLADIVSVSDNSFMLKPGQTKIIYINLSSYIEEKDIKHEPGVYVGSLLIKNYYYTKNVPVVVEIETKDVLVDVNVQLPIFQKQIKQDTYLEPQIQIFNLKKVGLTEVSMDYVMKDILGNSIVAENEDVTVETQASLSKTIHIPENLNPGEYIFSVVARYGSSVGTSTSLFEVVIPEVEERSIITSALTGYLGYGNTVALEKLSYLGNSFMNWFKNPFSGAIISLIAIICLIIIAKKISLLEKLKGRLKQRKVRKEEKEKHRGKFIGLFKPKEAKKPLKEKRKEFLVKEREKELEKLSKMGEEEKELFPPIKAKKVKEEVLPEPPSPPEKRIEEKKKKPKKTFVGLFKPKKVKKLEKKEEKKVEEISEDSKRELENYIKKSLNMGYSIKAIKSALVGGGLEEDFVDKSVEGYLAKEKRK